MAAYSIGYHRNDGDFQILATLNNNDELMTRTQFEALKEPLINRLYDALGADDVIVCLKRQDTPDYAIIESTQEWQPNYTSR